MYAGAVAVPIIVGGASGWTRATSRILVSADLLVSGIATLIQSVGIHKIIRGADAGGGRGNVHRAESDDHHRQRSTAAGPALTVRVYGALLSPVSSP